jgi:excisionase family DNA binding protein
MMSNNEKGTQPTGERSHALREEMLNSPEHELLERYLALPAGIRDQQFPNTANAASIVGLSRRTIQFWIEIGEVQAVLIGGKYRVSIDSLRDYLRRRGSERRR